MLTSMSALDVLGSTPHETSAATAAPPPSLLPSAMHHDPAGGGLLGPAGAAMPAAANGPSNRRLQAEKAGLYAKKYGARALDSALFAPLHLIDQASIADVHAVDAMNFVA